MPVLGSVYATTVAGTDVMFAGTVTGTGVVAVGLNATGATNIFGAPPLSTYVGGSHGFPLNFNRQWR